MANYLKKPEKFLGINESKREKDEDRRLLKKLVFQFGEKDLGEIIDLVKFGKSTAWNDRRKFKSVTSLIDRCFPPFPSTTSKLQSPEFTIAARNSLLLLEIIEDYYVFQMFPDPISLGFKSFLKFEHLFRIPSNWCPYFTRLAIRDLDYPITGVINILYYKIDDPKKLILCNWKLYSGNIFTNDTGMGYGPLRANNGSKYNRSKIQLNLYKYILEKPKNGYNKQINEMFLIQINENENGGFILHNIKPMNQTDIEVIIEYSLKNWNRH